MLHCAEQKLSQQMTEQQNGAESLPQSTSSIKERDYIGLAEVSSAPPAEEAEDAAQVMMMEPDLRLGLGLPSPNPAEEAFHATIALHCPSPKILPNAMAIAPARPGYFKSSTKRYYEEAMAVNVKSVSARFNAIDSRSSSSPPLLKSEAQAAEAKPSACGARISPWHCQSDSEAILYRSKAGLNSMPLSGAANGEGHPKFDLRFRRDGGNLQPYVRQDNSFEEAQPPKGQVIGWPPVRSYRRTAIAACTKPDGHEGVGHSSIFVKVNMDGSPIGRKVDLSAYKSYDGLLSALENMFQKLNRGHGPQSLNCADFVLTYEDKEGDWMLVGDVPWEFFVKTARRLRITRGSNMAGGSSMLAAVKLL